MRKIFLFIAFISMYFLGQAQYAPTSSKTRFVNGIGLSTKDTASLSNAGDTLAMIVGKDSLVYFKYKGYWKPIAYNSSLNSYVKYSDTSSMLSPYQRSFSAMKYSDTATMLSSYYNKTATNSLLNTKLNTSDTATMLSGYKTYYPRNAISGGTGISYNSSTGVITNTSSGTVTSVATNNGSGITGGTITTSGTIAADTSVLATRLRVQKGIDSVNANVSLKLNISDTANMLSGYKTYYPRNAISGGTGITYNAGTGVITNSSPSSGGTVTSVATDATMTGGTITTTGTLKVDTTVMATRLRVQKGIDSVSANINLRVKYSDTATMLSSYYNKTATDSKLALKLNISDTATMLSPYARTLALGGYIPYTGATGAIDLNAKTVVNISKLGINTTTVPTISLRAIGDNNSTSRIAMRGYSSDANSSSIRVTKFRGTAASPQAPLSGDGLGKFELAGYGTTSSDGYPQASFEGIATENWGATARGAKVQVKVTPNTTTTQAIALTINQDKSAVFENSITGTSLIKTGGTSSQFLKADGSVDANAYLNISDTATMLSGYKTYYPRAALSAGTGITYNASTGVITNSSPSTGGTVTSVATNTGSGITGGTITTSGTIAADTSVLATRLRVQKGIDSLGAAKISGSGTINYIPKFTSSSAIGNSLIYDNGTSIGINYTNPTPLGGFVINNSNSYLQLVVGDITTPTNNAGLYLRGTVKNGISVSSGSELGFFGAGGGINQWGIFYSNGNFGINSSSDNGYKFQLTGSSFFNTQGTSGLNVSGYQPTNFINLNNVLSANNRTFSLIAGINSVGYDGFSILDTYANATRFSIDNNGITSISSRLNVNGATDDGSTALNVSGAGKFTGNVSSDGILIARTTTNGNSFYSTNGTDSDIGIFVQTNNIRFSNSGTYSSIDFTTAGTIRLALSYTGAITMSSLAGTGSRIVVADASGTLSATTAAATSGTYTPTITLVTNAASSTARVCQYMRVGSVVTVSGYVTVTATTPAASSRIYMSLPISSSFTSTAQAGGAGGVPGGADIGTVIFANSTSTTVSMDFLPVSGATDYWFSYTYQIL
jgi:hypothetical protein